MKLTVDSWRINKSMSMHDAKTCYKLQWVRAQVHYISILHSRGHTVHSNNGMTWTQTGSRLANPDPCLVLICKRIIM